MFEIVKAGGIVMVPIILASIVAAAIFLERVWTLQLHRVVPAELTAKVWKWVEQGQIGEKHIHALQQNSPLGRILAAGLANRHRSRDVINQAIEDTGRHVVHELERFLNALGTIASISPLMGLLGTVLGMIEAFQAVAATHGQADVGALSDGISTALTHTFLGLFLAVPCLAAFGILRTIVDRLTVRGAMVAEELLLMMKPSEAKPAAVAATGTRAGAIPQPAIPTSPIPGARKPAAPIPSPQ